MRNARGVRLYDPCTFDRPDPRPQWSVLVVSLQPRVEPEVIQRFDRCLLALTCGSMLSRCTEVLDRLHRVPGASLVVVQGENGWEAARWPIVRPAKPEPRRRWPWLRLLFGRWS